MLAIYIYPATYSFQMGYWSRSIGDNCGGEEERNNVNVVE